MSAGPIKPIETKYSGCTFRSRTEARWAVFFDALGWRWDFEPEGFKLPSGPYLPDFRVWTNSIDPIWFEVKPFIDGRNVSDPRWGELAKHTDTEIVTAYGMHRSGDKCLSNFNSSILRPHAGRICLPSGVEYMMGPFWVEAPYEHAWVSASSARFEFGHSGRTQ